MSQNRFFADNPNRSGMVIVFPPGVASLFNPSVHTLVREVERRLDGVFTTFALSGGGGPDVEAALNAARFAGCSSAVVAYPEDWFLDGEWTDEGSDSVLTGNRDSSQLRDTAQRLVDAYSLVRSTTGLAA